ncbi:hypothetical protein [Brachyspira sp.]|nr:hypothetical protein [Brachyspira sp.]
MFLPVEISWSITRKMGTTQILGILLVLHLPIVDLLESDNT